MKTLIETIRGGNQLCYAPPQSYSVGARTDSERAVPLRLRFTDNVSSFITSFLGHLNSEALMPQSFYTHSAHGCWDELNYGGEN